MSFVTQACGMPAWDEESNNDVYKFWCVHACMHMWFGHDIKK